MLSASPIEVGGKTGFMAVVTDITKRKQAEDALGRSEEKFRTLVNNLNVGIFRRTLGPNPKFIEANPELVTLLGYASKEDLLATPVISLYCNPDDRKTLELKASAEELKREIVKLRKKDGTVFIASIWGVMVEDEDGVPRYCDGIMEDITELHMREKERAKLLDETQTVLLFYNQPLGDLPCRQPALCHPGMPIGEAVRMLEQQHNDVMLVRDAEGRSCGVITDHDLRKAVRLLHEHEDRPVSELMSSPVISLPGNASVFEAWWLMQNKGISHLFVTDTQGAIIGLINSKDIAAIQKYSPAVLLREISNDASPDEVIRHNEVLPYLITTLITSGAKPQSINHLTTIVIDTILQKLLEFAIRELGPPPVRFAFLVFGSEGRQEQTLMTDQDNAIIFEDAAADLESSVVRAYFLKLGAMVCRWLNQAGYNYCDGNNMAQNPQWCQPLTVWKRYFSEWIHAARAEDLLNTKIFFDFRCAFGDATSRRSCGNSCGHGGRQPALFSAAGPQRLAAESADWSVWKICCRGGGRARKGI